MTLEEVLDLVQPTRNRPTVVSDELANRDRMQIASDDQLNRVKMNDLILSKNPEVHAVVVVLRALDAKPRHYAEVFDSLVRMKAFLP